MIQKKALADQINAKRQARQKAKDEKAAAAKAKEEARAAEHKKQLPAKRRLVKAGLKNGSPSKTSKSTSEIPTQQSWRTK